MTAIVGLTHAGSVYIGGDSAGVSGLNLTVRADATGKLDTFMATTFIDAVRDCLKAGGWAAKENDREEGGTFLVGVRGQLFAVYNDYQVAKAADGFAAVGCGDQVALGALFATAGTAMGPRRRVKKALTAAERFSAGVRGPFVCLKGR